ncbi:class I SAM-dependent methyltransferase [Priestia megaterium]|uniref:class I SAM-dependent methyltransferase n=1 Tax=Priestia megaterium TaxID=1404 RepID=UPI003F821EF0
MKDYRISEWFINKPIRTLVEDIYADTTFSLFYDNVGQNDIYNDINRYCVEIRQEPVLEVGTGNGRVFKELVKRNINIYGIEPSKEMLNLMEAGIKQNVYKETFESFIENLVTKEAYLIPKTIIIPATSISLFQPVNIINNLKSFQKRFNFLPDIIFDFNKISSFSDDLQYHYTDEGKFYFSNHIHQDEIFYNIYKDGKLGVSKKYIYNLEIIDDISSNLNCNFKVIFENENYYMVKLYE